jgi:hypothetical protein
MMKEPQTSHPLKGMLVDLVFEVVAILAPAQLPMSLRDLPLVMAQSRWVVHWTFHQIHWVEKANISSFNAAAKPRIQLTRTLA